MKKDCHLRKNKKRKHPRQSKVGEKEYHSLSRSEDVENVGAVHCTENGGHVTAVLYRCSVKSRANKKT